MLEIPTACGILDGESYLLQRNFAVIVGAQHVDARLLQCTKQAPPPHRLIVFTLAIVGAVPYRFIFEKLGCSVQNV
jgi:putative flippase GtrA